ncbi:MAG: hypothetical protein ACYDBB_13830 [Armatimonadota bacterium]
MKMHLRKLSCFLVVIGLWLLTTAAFALTDTATQTFNLGVDEIAEIAVSGNPAALQLIAPGTPGDIPPAVTDATTTMSYTSVVIDLLKARAINAQITAGTVPAGCKLYLSASTPAGAGIGTIGAGQSDVEITTGSTADIITGIGSCATNGTSGAEAGSTLTYSLEVDDIAAVKKAVAAAITVTLTLTAEN